MHMYHLESDVLAMQFGFGDETTPSTCCRSSGLGVIKTLLTENEELALSFGCAFDESCCGAPPYIKVNEEQRIRALFKRIVDADTLPNAIRDRVILDPQSGTA